MPLIKTSHEFAGTGCLIQGIGLVLLFFFPIGTFIGLLLLVYGSTLSKRYKCGNCGNRIENKDVKMCPVCRENLYPA